MKYVQWVVILSSIYLIVNFSIQVQAIEVKKENAIPELTVEDVYIYLDKEWEMDRFFKNVEAYDEEDGDITSSVVWENREEAITELKLYQGQETEGDKDKEYVVELRYSITDSFGNMVEKSCYVHAYRIGEKTVNKGYVRFISYESMDTLNEASVWRETEMYAILERTLR